VRRTKVPANDTQDTRRQGLAREDLATEIGLKRAEERIARAMGAPYSGGARWMLRRLRQRLFSSR